MVQHTSQQAARMSQLLPASHDRAETAAPPQKTGRVGEMAMAAIGVCMLDAAYRRCSMVVSRI